MESNVTFTCTREIGSYSCKSEVKCLPELVGISTRMKNPSNIKSKNKILVTTRTNGRRKGGGE